MSVKKKEGLEQRLLSDGQIGAGASGGLTTRVDNSGNSDLPVQGDKITRHNSVNFLFLQTKGTDISPSRCFWCKAILW